MLPLFFMENNTLAVQVVKQNPTTFVLFVIYISSGKINPIIIYKILHILYNEHILFFVRNQYLEKKGSNDLSINRRKRSDTHCERLILLCMWTRI